MQGGGGSKHRHPDALSRQQGEIVAKELQSGEKPFVFKAGNVAAT
jgi:hypothetical protein